MIKVKEIARYRDGGTLKVIVIENYKDGGTQKVETTEGDTYFIDHRIMSETKGKVYTKYPTDDDAELIDIELEIVGREDSKWNHSGWVR